LIRDFAQKYCLKSQYELISEIKKINPTRSPMSVRSKLSQILRRERTITDGLRQRILEKWRELEKRNGSAPKPSAVCWVVSIRIPIGFELFVKTCSDMGLLPAGADWKSLIPAEKTCTRCTTKKPAAEFALDPATSSGLSRRCKACASKKSPKPMKSDPLAAEVSSSPPQQGGGENLLPQPEVETASGLDVGDDLRSLRLE